LFTHEAFEKKSDKERDKTKTGPADDRQRESIKFQKFSKIHQDVEKNCSGPSQWSSFSHQDFGELKREIV